MGKARGGLHSHDEREQTLNQLLTEMDGFSSGEVDGSQVLVLAATNRAATLDPALTRPGRFDRHVTVGLADAEGRAAILAVHTRRVKLARNVDVRCVVCAARGVRRAGVPRGRAARACRAGVPRAHLPLRRVLSTHTPISPRLHLALSLSLLLQIKDLAARAEGLSGAELAGVINDAALLSVRHGRKRVDAAALDEALARALECRVKERVSSMRGFISGSPLGGRS